MYENQIEKAQCVQGSSSLGKSYSPTLAQNIDNRITQLTDQVERLKSVKAKLEKGNILDIPIDDLRFAMNY